jgi:hypothetical protein
LKGRFDVAAKPVAPAARRLNRKQLAKYLLEKHRLPVTARMLADLARQGKGPAFILFRKFRLSTPEQADEWATEVEARGSII